MKEFLPNRLARLKRDLQIKLEIKAFPKCNIIIQDKFSEKQFKAKADTTGMASVMIPYRGDWIVTAQYQGYEISDEIQCGSYSEDYFLDLTKTCSLTIQTDEGNLIELINGDERIEAVVTNGSFNEIVQGGTWTLVVRDADNADLKIMTRFEIPLDQREAIKELYFPTITVSGDNADISVESGNISLNKIMNGDTVKFKVIPGVWTVKSSLGGDKDEKIVEVSEIGTNYEVEFYFPEVTIKTDVGNWVEISENEKIVVSGIATNGKFKIKLGSGNWKVKSCLNNNRAIYVEDEFEIENLEENKEVELYLSTISITSDAWEGIVVTADNFGLRNTGVIDANGNTVIKVGVGNWQIGLSKGRIAATAATIIKHSQDVKLNLDVTFIYGIKESSHLYSNSGYVFDRTDDAIGFTNFITSFINNPSEPGYTTYGSPFDDKMPWAGMKIVDRKVSKRWSKMVSIPKFWYQLTSNNGYLSIKISDKKVPGFYTSPAHRDRGDGKGERDVVYIGRYHIGGTSQSVYYESNSGLKAELYPIFQDIVGEGKGLYYCDFHMRFTLWLLYLVEYRCWNVQQVIGKGGGSLKGGSATRVATGYTDEMPYHTGTMKKSRDTQGSGIQYRYIEGLWDNVKEWVLGCYYTSSGFYVINNVDEQIRGVKAQSGGVFAGLPTTGYPRSFKIVNVGFPIFIPDNSYKKNDTAGHPIRDEMCTFDYWSFSNKGIPIYSGGAYLQYSTQRNGLFRIGTVEKGKKSSLTGLRIMELP